MTWWPNWELLLGTTKDMLGNIWYTSGTTSVILGTPWDILQIIWVILGTALDILGTT